MSKIPEEYLPPKDHLSEKIYPLPELRLPRELNLGHLFLDRHIRDGRGPNIAMRHEDKEITFFDFQREVNRLANALRSLGIEKNDRVMLRSPNRPEWIVACFACWKIAAIPVLVHHQLRREEIIFRANDSEAKVIVVSADAFPEVEKSLDKCPFLEKVIIFGEKIGGHLFYDDLLRDQSDQVQIVETTKDDWARIIYTSGTTGKPKGILATNGDMVTAATIQSRYLLNLSPEEVLGGHSAFTYAFGFFPILFFGYMGCTLSVIDQFTPESMFQTVESHRITFLRCVPTLYRMMLQVKNAEKKYDLSSLRLCQSAGEWLPATTVREWKRRFGVIILDSVGSADLHSTISTRVDTPSDKLDSSGIPLPGIDCKIVDENFDELPRGVPGELVLRAPWGLQYWRRPDVQKKTVIHGWNRTGLIFVEDNDGYFWFKGRDDDMIVSSGYKIPGGEVETVLSRHEAVLEVVVIPSPDTIRGNIVKAFVVLKKGYEPSDQLADELKDLVKRSIEPYKYPRKIEFVDRKSLPRTSTGKVKRFVLRDKEKEQFEKEKGNDP